MSTSIFKTTQNTRMLIKGSARYIRSDIPEKLTRGEIEWLLSNNVKTVVDLRSERECKKSSCCLINEPGFNYINLPVSNGNAIPAKPELVASSYLDMIDEKMFEIIKTIENSEDNVLFFCTAGKDRTGVVSALLLKRMGVSDDEIVADYLESADNLRARLDAYASEHPGVDIEVITPKGAYMRGFLESCDEKWECG